VQDRFQNRAGGTLAVGTTDHDEGKTRLEGKPLLDAPDPLKAERDRFWMQALEVR
jgi:hypothetical protein